MKNGIQLPYFELFADIKRVLLSMYALKMRSGTYQVDDFLKFAKNHITATIQCSDYPEKFCIHKIQKSISFVDIIRILDQCAYESANRYLMSQSKLANNPTSAIRLVVDCLPRIVEHECSKDRDSALELSKELLKNRLTTYIGNGISQNYYNFFNDTISQCKDYNDLYKRINKMIENSISCSSKL